MRLRDHPRACGEHAHRAHLRHLHRGSSPRLRGTHVAHGFQIFLEGIIPALAGNTHRPCSVTSSTRDHPRACGEHTRSSMTPRGSRGSSPRLRGTLDDVLVQPLPCGIIPALAGNTDFHALGGVRVGDHPRACGEHSVTTPSEETGTGSSPRLRGTQHTECRSGRYLLIIPALAGNTGLRQRAVRVARDHPRACGEHKASDIADAVASGSSPRLRGTQPTQTGRPERSGIIPALAGNTS